jgi:hypothetical protein
MKSASRNIVIAVRSRPPIILEASGFEFRPAYVVYLCLIRVIMNQPVSIFI